MSTVQATALSEAVLDVVQAARAWAPTRDSRTSSGTRDRLTGAVAFLESMLAPDPDWGPGTWADVEAGDRVRLAGQHEAEVMSAHLLTWAAAGTTEVKVWLRLADGTERSYSMPPAGPIEILRPAPPTPLDLEELVTVAAQILKEEAS